MKPIFISGLYRSGTTILTRIIDQANELCSTYDTIHFMRFSYNKYLPIEDNYKKLVQDTRDRVYNRWKLDFNVENVINYLEQKEITQATVYNCMMAEFLELKDDKRWAEKTNVEWESIPDFLEMFPDGKVIHIYRDPRAVLASYKNMTNQPGLMYLDAIFASLAMFNFMQKNEIRNNKQIMLLSYEEFVKAPEKWVKNICEFLEVEFKDSMLNVSEFKDMYGNSFERNSSFKGHKNSIDTSSMDVWKEKLSDIEIYFCEMVLKSKLIEFDYELTGIDLNKDDFNKLYDILHDNFIEKRYKYWLKYGNGVQGYTNTENIYVI